MPSSERATSPSGSTLSTISEIMRSPAITVDPADSLSKAVALMVHHGVSELPVVDSTRELIGIIGEADLYRARLTDEQTHFGTAAALRPYDGRVVSDLMRRPVITVSDTDSLRLCQERLMGQARTLPVLHAGAVIGTVDRQRLLEVYVEWDSSDSNGSTAAPSTVGLDTAGRGRRADTTTRPDGPPAGAAPHVSVGMVMSHPVITVTQEQTLAEVWSLMTSRGIRHVAVMADGHCVGVIDDRQVAAVWPEGPAAMKTTLASQFVDRRVAGVLPHAPLSEAAAILKDDGVGAVPVIDDHGALLGLLTAVDIVQAVAQWGIDATTISDPEARREIALGERVEPPSSPTTHRQPDSAAMSANAAFILAAERPA